LIRQPIRKSSCYPILLVCGVLLLAACNPAPTGDATPNVPPTRGELQRPADVPWRAVGDALGLTNAQQITQIGTLNAHRATVNKIVFSPDSRRMITIDGTNVGIVWDMQTGQRRYPLQGTLTHAAFGADSSGVPVVITADASGVITFVNADDGRVLAQVPGDQSGAAGGYSAFALSPDGTRLATGTVSGSVAVWDVGTRRELWESMATGTVVRALAFLPNGAAGTDTSTNGSTLAVAYNSITGQIFNAETGASIQTFGGFADALVNAVYAPNGSRFAASTLQGIAVYDVPQYRQAFIVAEDDSAPGRGMAFSPDATLLYSLSTGDRVYVWDSSSGGEPIAALPGHAGRATGVFASPNGELLLTTTAAPEFGAYVWSVASMRGVGTNGEAARGQIAQGSNGIYTAAWSPDGRMIVIADASGGLTVWGASAAP
jgi:WD40 repeat protein